MTSVLEDPTTLQLNYLPETFVDRSDEQAALKAAFTDVSDSPLRNLHLHGPHGSGKTHLTHYVVDQLPDQVNKVYVPCTIYDSQYKVLKQICKAVTEDEVGTGHHTSELQRRIEKHTKAIPNVVILDEIDFLLMNDGDDLLYYLSRMENSRNLAVIVISSNTHDLEDQVEERTYSTLQPERIEFKPYSGETVYQILAERARKALKKQSLQKEALTYIASTTNNLKHGLIWLRYAAETASQSITEALVHEIQKSAYQGYIDHLLDDFTEHHYTVYQAVYQTSNHGNTTVQTGEIYDKYKEICHINNLEPLSNRRISDYLKQLELLNIIKTQYHYGGKNGKTRDITIKNGIQ